MSRRPAPQLCLHHCRVCSPPTDTWEVALTCLTATARRRCPVAFELYDSDNSGVIDHDEFASLARNILIGQLNNVPSPRAHPVSSLWPPLPGFCLCTSGRACAPRPPGGWQNTKKALASKRAAHHEVT